MAACTACTVATLTSMLTEGTLVRALSDAGAVTLGGAVDSPATTLVATLGVVPASAVFMAASVTMVATRGLPEPSTVYVVVVVAEAGCVADGVAITWYGWGHVRLVGVS